MTHVTHKNSDPFPSLLQIAKLCKNTEKSTPAKMQETAVKYNQNITNFIYVTELILTLAGVKYYIQSNSLVCPKSVNKLVNAKDTQ